MSARPFEYAIATTREAIGAATRRGYRIKAGGLDLMDMLKERIEKAPRLVSILDVPGLRGIVQKGNALSIGPLTTLKEIGAHPLLRERFAALAHSAGEAATPQIRAVATAAGNICQRPRCWYFRSKDYDCLKKGGSRCFAADGENAYHAIFGEGPCHIVHPSNIAPALVAAGAEVIAERDGKTRTIPMGEFFEMPRRNMFGENALAEGELIVEIRVPELPERSGYVELREKQSFDWPLAACAAVKVAGKWNVVLGAVAPTPWRAVGAEQLLGTANDIDDAMAERAADAAVVDASPMTQNAWRVRLARAAVRRALLTAVGKEAL
jgi:xanthine dehydrogenase YagS FAD-binding subunit